VTRKKAEAPGGAAMIEIDVKALRAALKGVVDVVEARNTVPILANLQIHAAGTKLTLTGTDLDMWVERHADLAQPARGVMLTTVPAKLLAAVAAKLPAEAMATLTFSPVEMGQKLRVTAGRARFDLQTLPADDFPVPPAGDGWDHQFELQAFDLTALIAGVRHAISTEETRYYLNGIFFHAAEARGDDTVLLVLRGVATDGHRLARFDLPQPDGSGGMAGGAIVGRKTMATVDKLLAATSTGSGQGFEGKVELAFAATRVRFDLGDTVVTAKLIDGTFPDYTRVIPAANDKHVAVDPKALAEAADRLAVICSEKTRAIACELGPDKMTLTVRSPEHGSAVEEVPCSYAGEALTVGFNVRYLGDVLSRIQGDAARMSFSDHAGPVLIRDTNDDARGLHVLMPLRV
jgi:DNA polymerase III subunit beta